ncbi:hypothetical protein NPS53_09025 [Pseudomonas putida]|uniref:hypothetical protein n=1 Tax=Pseudomonas putida TaxID=303 RepID=UPI002364618E|nr:hypothetical protein [Pseudomonas putida]MDD2139717.1 hypothetical protein [Pseudomonas putida]HDS1721641.1 hypothetical protein [Pseudomonas putida]
MNKEALTAMAIEAGKLYLGREIVIQSDADFTPPGKRVARLVRHTMSGRRTAAQIRWYVAGKAYRSLPLTAENAQMTSDWKGAGQSASESTQLALL